MPAFFAITLFVSSALLFLIQPMFARMVLPLLGGTPAVWNTCLVFFQVTLLAGYLYAHAMPRWLGLRRQPGVHVALLLVPLLLLPIRIARGWAPPTDANPIPALLGLLTVTLGLPFFLVATSGPLLAALVCRDAPPLARDPYFLYAASNLGSLLALLAYPLLLEPTLPLTSHSWLWSGGYGLFVVLAAGCAWFLWRAPAPKAADRPSTASSPSLGTSRISAGRRLRWLVLAFVPSSLLLSVTTYLTTDIAAIPLFWVVPLALYLLSFVLVFARRSVLPHAWMARILPLIVLLLTLAMLAEATQPIAVLVPLHLLGLFVVAMVCHGELARLRPDAAHLTEFYLWLSIGGALGGLFTALVAPLLFSSLIEYPLVLVLACFLRPPPAGKDAASSKAFTLGDAVAPLLLTGFTIASIYAVQELGVTQWPLTLAAEFGISTVICYTFLARPARFALGIGGLLAAGILCPSVYGKVELRERSFFGVHRVTVVETPDLHLRYRQLVHGNTVHGRQSLDSDRRREPLSYYTRSGPVGQVFRWFGANLSRVGVIGLGAGSLACYGEPGQQWTYYEIDPAVIAIAGDRRYFTFLGDLKQRGGKLKLVTGDARLRLAESTEGEYQLLVVDAFSSDAIPIHLITRQALDLYDEKLAAEGVLAFHVSNRYLDLEPVLGDLASARGWVCYAQQDLELEQEEREYGKDPSHWVVLARDEKSLAGLLKSGRWHPVHGRPGVRPWSDDFYNLLSAFRWEN